MTTRDRVLLATSDPVFAALCTRALQLGSGLRLLAAVPPAQLLETLRRLEPDVLILDTDGQDVPAFKALASKVALVSSAQIVLVSAYLAPGAQDLGTLLQSIAARFVQKPRGATSLSLADEDGPSFAAAVQEAFATHDGEDLSTDDLEAPSDASLRVSHLDDGWDLEAEPATPRRGPQS